MRNPLPAPTSAVQWPTVRGEGRTAQMPDRQTLQQGVQAIEDPRGVMRSRIIVPEYEPTRFHDARVGPKGPGVNTGANSASVTVGSGRTAPVIFTLDRSFSRFSRSITNATTHPTNAAR
jgi:hypothetical protein